ncbi:hypothetical protein CIL05_07485 [Virgibacillus profundi]|uniref:Uncharacterized protein n=1 Tax=Virgibacillus profundi TaxID=2024555 RepID=A0A2A2IGT9_9BACI|nr:hypothetical protein [Virgibacillus profundi]PAV30303.1 hypothetical protein CIL05_07485 [Virgibacillus profundi]PXY54475.1 hypothetical protein CIT14_07570 [Virgibacillus profundi]
MKAILKHSFSAIFIYGGNHLPSGLPDSLDEVDSQDIYEFKKGDEVDVIKVVNNPIYDSGKGYVIMNQRSETVTVDELFLEINQ